MKKCLSAIALLAAATTICTATPATAGESARKSYVGPTITSVYGITGFGVNSRFGIADNISARPFAIFFSENGASATVFGSYLTYDYNFPSSDWTISGGIGFATGSGSNGRQASTFGLTIGADYRISDSITLNARGASNEVTLGAGFNF
jgi:hypothetical protein